MPYTREQWRRRIAERSDLTTGVVHLTRETEKHNVMDVLLTILREKRIKASDTASGFIVGATPAVCFQDAPPHGLSQNVRFEQKKRESDPKAKLRYRAVGLWFPKPYVYRKGGRPVIYDKTEQAKKYLPKEHWWRIVNFDLTSDDNFIDWSHEREWRVPGDFTFELKEVTVLLTTEKGYHSFLKYGREGGINLPEEVGGVITLTPVLF